MNQEFKTIKDQDRAILIGITNRNNSYEQSLEYMQELSFLVSTAGALSVHSELLSVDQPKAATFLGSGKLQEIKEKIELFSADVVIFDDDLSPTQVRNIEKIFERRVIDRSGLILHIFSERARTAQAKAQVELAKLQYLLPRLTKMWTHLGRERGGIGLKGAGEQEIETDRRIIKNKIARLKIQLSKIDQQNITRRKKRSELARVTLVGYTNVGKSTILNLITKSDVLAENKLFATLDTTVRKAYAHNIPFLLADTVGFIRKLPHHLVESFKSTLDEVKEADILLHVVDISNMHYIEHMKVVNNTLAELKALDKTTIIVFNKIDELSADEITDLENTWIYNDNYPAVFISASQKKNIDSLRDLLFSYLQHFYKNKYVI